MQTKISKIILEVGGKSIELTEEEAKSLKDKLNELFNGKDVIYVPYEKEVVPSNPYREPYRVTWMSYVPEITTGTHTTSIGLRCTSG